MENSAFPTEQPQAASTTPLDPDPEAQLLAHYYHVSEQLFSVISPIILMVGLTGNTLTALVMARPSLRRSPVAVYLTALAVSDSIVLVMDFINNWFKMVLNIYLLRSPGFCKFHRYIFDVVYTHSSWLVVAVSVERFIVVWFPLKAKVMCTVKTARVTCCILPIILLCVYLYRAVAWDVDDAGKCNMRPDFNEFESNVGPWISGTLFSYIPILALITINSLIVVRLSRMASQRGKMMTTDSSSATPSQGSKENKITKMVVTICVVFVLFTLPLSLFYIVQFALGEFIQQSPKVALAEVIILIIGLCNYAVNFFLYVMTSKGFRSELRVILCHCCPATLQKTPTMSGSAASISSHATEQSSVKNTQI